MTRQQIFNKVSKHLLKQRTRSIEADVGGCAYYGDNKLKCAIGCLIPTKLYNKEMEGELVCTSIVSSALGECHPSRNMGFLIDLQFIHDDHEPSSWKEKLIDLAYRYNLKA